jgi:hypothetical protein
VTAKGRPIQNHRLSNVVSNRHRNLAIFKAWRSTEKKMQQEALEDDRDRFEAEALQRVQRVAQEVGVRGQHHKRVARDEQVAELQEIERRREHRQRDHGQDQARAQQVLQVALDLRWLACAFALIKDVEAEVEKNRRDQRRHCHHRVEVAEARIAQA